MALFYWNSRLETGRSDIDEQHRRLFNLTNELADLVAGNGPLPEVEALIGALRDYAARHFCDEEAILRCSRLAEREQERHVCAHRSFIARVEEFAASGDLSDTARVTELLDFLILWLVTHILKMDQRIVRPETGEGAPASPLGGDVSTVERALITALAETERRFRTISDNAPAMIWICGPSGARDFVNQAWWEYTGASDDLLDEGVWMGLVHPDDRERYGAFLAQLLARPERAEIELRIRTRSGEWGWVIERVMPRTDGNAVHGLIAAASDVTAIKQSEAFLAEANRRLEREVRQRTRQLEVMALTDPLTGVANRRALYERLADEHGRATADGRALSLLYLDIDHFKAINDRFGHAAGDSVLADVAAVLKGRLRSADVIGRVGGEEFVVVLPGARLDQALVVAEDLRRSISERVTPVPDRVTASIGVACRRAGETAETLVRRADDALLTAKREGRDRICTADLDRVA